MNKQHHTGPRYLVATDGACLGNPGPGGWGIVIHRFDGETIVSRHALAGCADGDTTNNKMELQAAIEALGFLGDTNIPVTITSDSKYLVDGMTLWLPRWQDRGWRTSDRKPVKNRGQWETLDRLSEDREVTWEWTRGHDGHRMNEAADMLANNAASGIYGCPVVPLEGVHPELFEQGQG